MRIGVGFAGLGYAQGETPKRVIRPFYINTNPTAALGTTVRPTGWDKALNGVAVLMKYTDNAISNGGNRCFYTLYASASERALLQKTTVSGNNRQTAAMTTGHTVRISNRPFARGLLSGYHIALLIIAPNRQEHWQDGMKLMKSTAFSMPTFSASAGGLYIGGLQDGSQLISGDANVTIHEIQMFDADNLPITDEECADLCRNLAIVSGVTRKNSRGHGSQGQSNDVGQAQVTITYDAGQLPKMKMLKHDGTYVQFADPLCDKTGSLIPALDTDSAYAGFNGYAEQRIAELRDDVQCFSAASVPGTSIVATTGSGLTNAKSFNASTDISAITQTGGSNVLTMGTIFMAGLQKLILLSQHTHIESYRIAFGESDAVGGTSKSAMKTALAAHIAQVRLIFPGIKIYLQTLGAWNDSTGATEENWNNINTAIVELAAETWNCELIDVRGVAMSGIHYTDTGNQAAGLIIGNTMA